MSAPSSNRLAAVLLGLFSLVWVALAIAPRDRSDWFLENLLVFAGLPLVVRNHRRRPLSRLAYTCIFLFLVLHEVGAHYTYSEVPLGNVFKGAWGLSRNHFDRVVHFSFGLFMAVPLFELQSRLWARRGWWNFILPITVTLSGSTVYEIMEWVVALMADPASGTAFVGTQGDVWDAQKDTVLALAGACVSMCGVWIADLAGHSLLPARPKS